ncbi:MAG: right-handed parallel beta-helix repeat-containing protein [Kiritimatiellia bacterium]
MKTCFQPVPRVVSALLAAAAVFILPCALADDHYAARNGQTPIAPYTTWVTAASSIQDAVNAATTNDTVWVGPGRYTVPTNSVFYIGTNVVYIDKPLTLRGSSGSYSDTIIDGSGTNRGVAAVYRTSVAGTRIVIDGLTVSNCFATNSGGGILFDSFDYALAGVVQNCNVSDNTVAWGSNSYIWLPPASRGGGICSYSRQMSNGTAQLILSNCVVRNNKALSRGPIGDDLGVGGGVAVRSSGLKNFYNCLFENNSAGGGGAVYIYAGTQNTIENCVIRSNRAISAGNTAWVHGGGLYFSSGTHVLRNNLIHHNQSDGFGGGVSVAYGIGLLDDCTIVSNTAAATWGSGLNLSFTPQGAGLRVRNSIVYDNWKTNENIRMDGLGTNSFFTNCCLSMTNSLSGSVTNILGTGNFTNAPLFIDVAGQNFRLRADSPCLNTGTNQAWMADSADLEGRARIRYGAVDMGACEVVYEGALFGIR